MYKLYIRVKDSISNEEQEKKFAEMEFGAKVQKLKSEEMVKEKMFKAPKEKEEQEMRNRKIISRRVPD